MNKEKTTDKKEKDVKKKEEWKFIRNIAIAVFGVIIILVLILLWDII